MVNRDKLDRFYAEVEQINSLYKAEIFGNLKDYFLTPIDENINWKSNQISPIKELVESAALKFLK